MTPNEGMLRWSPVRLSNMPYDVAPVTMRESNGDCVVACVDAYFKYRKENYANQGGNHAISKALSAAFPDVLSKERRDGHLRQWPSTLASDYIRATSPHQLDDYGVFAGIIRGRDAANTPGPLL